MPRWATQMIIAGVDFSNCRTLILDGGRFASDYKGSMVLAADGTPHIQRVLTGTKGLLFGASVLFANANDLLDLKDAIMAAEAAHAPFRVQAEDALVTIDENCWPDYNTDQWFSYGPESEGIVENFVLRLISVGPH